MRKHHKRIRACLEWCVYRLRESNYHHRPWGDLFSMDIESCRIGIFVLFCELGQRLQNGSEPADWAHGMDYDQIITGITASELLITICRMMLTASSLIGIGAQMFIPDDSHITQLFYRARYGGDVLLGKTDEELGHRFLYAYSWLLFPSREGITNDNHRQPPFDHIWPTIQGFLQFRVRTHQHSRESAMALQSALTTTSSSISPDRKHSRSMKKLLHDWAERFSGTTGPLLFSTRGSSSASSDFRSFRSLKNRIQESIHEIAESNSEGSTYKLPSTAIDSVENLFKYDH